jgi:hypothetical protein
MFVLHAAMDAAVRSVCSSAARRGAQWEAGIHPPNLRKQAIVMFRYAQHLEFSPKCETRTESIIYKIVSEPLPQL